MYWIGVDIGGTFTDAVVYDDETGMVRTTKCPSTPEEPSVGVLDTIDALGLDLTLTSRFRHGATVATNAALERKGARLGVVTTRGFRDVLIVGRGNRVDLYDIKAVRPAGLVRRSSVLEVTERITANGEVHTPLVMGDVEACVEQLQDVDAIAVCFLHAYANPTHERLAAQAIGAALDRPISCSSDVLPEHREFDRFATTALNAYVAPKMAEYLNRLDADLTKAGLGVRPEIMSSSGGSWSFERMAKFPVNSMLSGPAGGVLGASAYAPEIGFEDLITYDMGGTSTDVALLRGGEFALAMEGSVGGMPNRAPQIEINTVGAGGGSIAYLDEGGFLNVGPRSSGAIPGPACYGRGGTEPTVTDANVVLGRFAPQERLGGAVTIDKEAAHAAVRTLSDALGLDVMTTADGIVRIAVTRMTTAIKEISVMRGIDPRELALFSYGGAGPLHAALIAEELGMSAVIVPTFPGAFSAFGLLVAEPRIDVSRTLLTPVNDVTIESLEGTFDALMREAADGLADMGFAGEAIRFERSLDMRFVGQAFELSTPFGAEVTTRDALIAAFHAVYEERYTHADAGDIEIVSFRVSAFGATERPRPPTAPSGGAATPIARREIWLAGASHQVPVYHRDALTSGTDIAGPAIIDEAGSTTLVPTNARVRCHPSGALIMTLGSDR